MTHRRFLGLMGIALLTALAALAASANRNRARTKGSRTVAMLRFVRPCRSFTRHGPILIPPKPLPFTPKMPT